MSYRSPEVKAWDNMKQRCYNAKCINYKWYGAEGVTVCKRWRGEKGYVNFLKDMGLKPSTLHSLDRIDRRKPYQPSNCRWATKQEQVVNRRITKLSWGAVDSIKRNTSLQQCELAKVFDVHQSVISRIKNNLRWISK